MPSSSNAPNSGADGGAKGGSGGKAGRGATSKKAAASKNAPADSAPSQASTSARASIVPPKRKLPLDGVNPIDFVVPGSGKWPRAELAIPEKLDGLPEDQQARQLRTVTRLQALVRAFTQWEHEHDRTHESMSTLVGVGKTALRKFRSGATFPAFDTNENIRSFLELDREQEERKRAERE